MGSTFWPNPICERQSSQNRHTGLKFSPKRQNSALFMKIEQNALFRSCEARFGQIALLTLKALKIVTLAWNSLQNGKTVRFSWKLYKTLFSGHAEARFGQIAFLSGKVLEIVTLAWNSLAKTGKQCAFPKIVQNALFRSCGARFGQYRIFERQSSQNRHTGLKFSPKRENSALFMKIEQNALFRSCEARFGQIAFLSGKVLKIVTLAWNSLQNGKTVRFSWKLYKTLFSGHAKHVLAKSHFWAAKFSKSSHWPEILFKTGKQCAFHENCTKRSFQVMRSTFWPNRIFNPQSSENRHTGLKFSPKRENSALFMKIVQNALFRSCEARFGQIAFLSVKVLKIVTLAWNSRQNGKTVRFSWKLYKTLFSGHAEARFGQIAFLSVKVLKIVTLAWNSLQNGKTVRFSWKLYKTLFSGHAQHVLAKSHFWAAKFSKSSHWPKILFKTGKQCAFHENCTKRSFQVMRSTFWPNRTFKPQSSQNRHTGLKFSPKRENSALFMKIVQNALFRSWEARFGQIAFLSVKVLKIVTLAWNSRQNGKTVRFS